MAVLSGVLGFGGGMGLVMTGDPDARRRGLPPRLLVHRRVRGAGHRRCADGGSATAPARCRVRWTGPVRSDWRWPVAPLLAVTQGAHLG